MTDLWTFFRAVITQWVWLVTSSLAAGILFYFPELRSRVERIVGPGRLMLFGFFVATYFAWIQEHRMRLAADLRLPASVAEQMATLKAQQERRLREEWQPIEGRARQALVVALSEHSWDEPAKVSIVDNGSLDCLTVALDLGRVFEAAGWRVDGPTTGPVSHGILMKTGGIPKDAALEISAALSRALGAQAVLVGQYPTLVPVPKEENGPIYGEKPVNLLVMIGPRAD